MIPDCLHARPVRRDAWIVRIRTLDSAHPLTGSKSLCACRFAPDADLRLLTRSRGDVARITEQDEQMVGNLLSNTTTAGQLQRKPLHLSPLAHLGFDNLFEEYYIIHPDILYRLILRDAIPIARVSLPSPHVPRFKFQSGL